jgi:hypothetical protein
MTTNPLHVQGLLLGPRTTTTEMSRLKVLTCSPPNPQSSRTQVKSQPDSTRCHPQSIVARPLFLSPSIFHASACIFFPAWGVAQGPALLHQLVNVAINIRVTRQAPTRSSSRTQPLLLKSTFTRLTYNRARTASTCQGRHRHILNKVGT